VPTFTQVTWLMDYGIVNWGEEGGMGASASKTKEA